MSDAEATEPTTVVRTEVDTEAPEEGSVVGETTTTEDQPADEIQGDDESDTFARSYVEGLRRENARYRGRARNADTYARRLHTELVRATDRLADPTDLAFQRGPSRRPRRPGRRRRRPIDTQAAPGQQAARRRNRTRGLTSGGE